jgi:hypothetical protein
MKLLSFELKSILLIFSHHLENIVFQNVTPCVLLNIYGYFGRELLSSGQITGPYVPRENSLHMCPR